MNVRIAGATAIRVLTQLRRDPRTIALLLIVQMWLLTATLESYLAGHHEVALPAAIISGVLFLTCAGLNLFVNRIDAEARDAGEGTA